MDRFDLSLFFSQLKKIRTFLVILVFLFGVNIIFNINYQWDGVSTIVRVYVFVFSFLVVFYFSSMDIEVIKEGYKKKYGSGAVYMIFFMTRVLPFVMIYLVTVIYTFIDALPSINWPAYPFIFILDGRYSNTIFYALILLIVLKLKKPPRVTVPLFLVLSVIFFLADKTVYTYIASGWIISCVKFFKYFMLVFILIFEYLFDRARLGRAVFVAFYIASVMYLSVFGLIYGLYYFSDKSSYTGNRTAFTILKMGFSFPIEPLTDEMIKTGNSRNISTLIFYAEKYGKELTITGPQWSRLFSSGPLSASERIAGYLDSKGILIPYGIFMSAVYKYSAEKDTRLPNSKNIISYGSRYVAEHDREFSEDYLKGNIILKRYLLKVFGTSGEKKVIAYILGGLTDLDENFSKEVYDSLKKICGIDPVNDQSYDINSPETVAAFRRCYDNEGRAL